MIYSEFGNSIKDYDVYEEIGKGGFGRVFRAACRKTRHELAIKQIDKSSLSNQKIIERVCHEVQIQSTLDHPSILKLYTYFDDKDFVYLILEFCPNGDLAQKIKRNGRPFYENEAREYLTQVVDGVLYLHSRGIMHRDLTPTNLLLDSKGKVKIADFGLAAQLESHEEKHMTMCGTPNYISPEVAGKKSHGLEADVWNFGCLVYIMLVGHPPFEARLPEATLKKVLHGNYELPEYLAHNSKDLISKCLKKNPKERIQMINVLRHPFFKNSFHEGRGSNTHRSDSGLYTISTNATTTTQHTRAPLSALCEDTEQDSLHSGKNNRYYKPCHSPPVKLMSNSHENSRQPGGKLEHLRKMYAPFPYMNRNEVFNHDPAPLAQAVHNYFEYRPKVSLRENDVREREEISCLSARSRNNCNQEEERSFGLYGQQPVGEHMQCYDKQESYPRRHRLHMRNTNEDHRRSISSDGKLVSGERRHFHLKRSSSLDRERYEEERYKDRKLRIHSSDCQCDKCLQKPTTCSCYQNGSNYSNHRSWCEINNYGNPSSPCPKYIGKSMSSDRSGHNPHIRKDTAPNQRSECPKSPCKNGMHDSNTVSNSNAGIAKRTLQSHCLPLSTRRLKATRQHTKNVILNILDSGEVCVEFLHSKRGRKRVHDVCRISNDGLKIILYKPNSSSGGVPVSDSPPEIPPKGADAIFNYDNLPEKYWKKYIYAARFIKLVQAKTPKITYYSDKAKCFLMENSPNADFQATFFTGEKLVISDHQIHLTDLNERTATVDENSDQPFNDSFFQACYEHSKKVRDHCLKLEEALMQIEDTGELSRFPTVVGRKPSNSSPASARQQLQQNGSEKENISPLSLQSTSSRVQSAIRHLGPYESSVSSGTTIDSGFPSRKQRRPLTPYQEGNIVNNQKNGTNCEQLFVKNIGTAYRDSEKMLLKYLDGTCLEVQANQSSFMVYRDSSNKKQTYHVNSIPGSLLKKVKQFQEAQARLNPVLNDCRDDLSSAKGYHPVFKMPVINGSSNLPKCLR